MDYRLLGHVEVVHDGEKLALGGPRQPSVLAMLVLAAPEVVSTDWHPRWSLRSTSGCTPSDPERFWGLLMMAL